MKARNLNGDIKDFNCDFCLVSVGRKAYTDGLNLDIVNVELDSKGKIKVDNKFQSSNKNIYAIARCNKWTHTLLIKLKKKVLQLQKF